MVTGTKKIIGVVDITLDSSEFYDYMLGDNTNDYIYNKIVIPTITGRYLITEDNYILITEDNYILEY